MNSPYEPDHDLEERLSRRLLDIFTRAGLVLALVLPCCHTFPPFLTMMLWVLILLITIYPLHQTLAGRVGGTQGITSTLIFGMFIGATALALGYQIFMRWVDDNPERVQRQAASDSSSAAA